MESFLGPFMLFSQEVGSLIGAVGMISLAVSWHRRKSDSVKLAQFGWVLVGLTFFNDASKYLAHDDAVLTVFCTAALSDGYWDGNVGRTS